MFQSIAMYLTEKLLSNTFTRMVALYLCLVMPVLFVSWYDSEVHFNILSLGFLRLFLLLCVGYFIAYLSGLCRLFTFERYGHAVLVVAWLFASIIGMCVFLFYGLSIPWTDALFASVSGLTTTGAEVFQDLSLLPRSFLFFRMWLQFIGGLGIIMMAVIALGASTGQSKQIDLPGPVVSYSQKKPKLSDMGPYLWFLYIVAALVCMVCLKLLGLSWFECIAESLSIISTGGYALHNAGIAYYHSEGVQIIVLLFMLFSSVNFLLHYQFFLLRESVGYFKNSELRCYLSLCVVTVLACVCANFISGWVVHWSFLDLVFTIVSLFSSSGFIIKPLTDLPLSFSFLLIIIGLIGGCSASTSGGIKVIRLQFGFQEIKQAFQLLIHPRVVQSSPAIQVGLTGSSSEYQMILLRGFLISYVFFFALSVLVLLGFGLDFSDAYFVVCACLSNTGVFYSANGLTYASLSEAAKLWLVLTMLVGRIEILAFCVILSPQYWMER